MHIINIYWNQLLRRGIAIFPDKGHFFPSVRHIIPTMMSLLLELYRKFMASALNHCYPANVFAIMIAIKLLLETSIQCSCVICVCIGFRITHLCKAPFTAGSSICFLPVIAFVESFIILRPLSKESLPWMAVCQALLDTGLLLIYWILEWVLYSNYRLMPQSYPPPVYTMQLCCRSTCCILLGDSLGVVCKNMFTYLSVGCLMTNDLLGSMLAI